MWQLKDVGLQAAARIRSAADPLALLTEIAQNFPSLVSSLSRQPLDEEIRANAAANQQMVHAGANFMLLNGVTVDINNFELYGAWPCAPCRQSPGRLRAAVCWHGSQLCLLWWCFATCPGMLTTGLASMPASVSAHWWLPRCCRLPGPHP